MSASQLELIVDQIKLLAPDDLIKLIKRAAELLEQNQIAGTTPAGGYASLFGSGKGAFATPAEADHFLRSAREQR
jgi:hypothetical protein